MAYLVGTATNNTGTALIENAHTTIIHDTELLLYIIIIKVPVYVLIYVRL